MRCPKCGAEDQTIVRDSRGRGAYLKRRRECLCCGERFNTYEVVGKQFPDVLVLVGAKPKKGISAGMRFRKAGVKE